MTSDTIQDFYKPNAHFLLDISRICTHASHHTSPALNSWWGSFHCRMMQIAAAEQLLPVWHQYHGDPGTCAQCPLSLPDIWTVYRGGEKFQ